jgi:putative SOS response-associated peptidase YedK
MGRNPWAFAGSPSTRSSAAIDMPARFIVTPNQNLPIVSNDKDGNEIAEETRWWVVP